MEIERKWLVRNDLNLNDLCVYSKFHFTQVYIAIEDETEVRIRERHMYEPDDRTNYIITIKIGNGLVRNELEFKVTKYLYDKILSNLPNRIISKDMWTVSDDNLDSTIELHIYDNKLKGHIIAEKEFKSVEEANNYVPPEYCIKEVTNDDRYKNKSLSLNGWPK